MIKLIVKDIINSDTAVSTDDGDKLFKHINSVLKENKIAQIDFSGIEMMTTAFLNAAIGQLYNHYNSEQLNKSLKLVNVASEDIILFKKVITRAKEFFSNKKRFENSANQAIYGS